MDNYETLIAEATAEARRHRARAEELVRSGKKWDDAEVQAEYNAAERALDRRDEMERSRLDPNTPRQANRSAFTPKYNGTPEDIAGGPIMPQAFVIGVADAVV